MAQVFRKVFAPLLSRLEHADRHYGLGLLVASCIGTRARMGFLNRKAISGISTQPRVSGGRSTVGVTPFAPSPTLIITPDQEPYVRKLPCAPYFAKAEPPRLHWRRRPAQPTLDQSSHQKDSNHPPLFDLGDKAAHPPPSFKDVALILSEDNLDLLQFPEAITTAFDSDSNPGSGSTTSRSSSSSSDSLKVVVGSVLEHDSLSSPPEPLSTPPPIPRSLPLDPPALASSGFILPNPLGLVARGSSQGSAPSSLALSDTDADADYWAALNPYNSNPARYADQVTSPFGNTFSIQGGLGRGCGGTVVFACNVRTARCVAIKVMHKRSSCRKVRGPVEIWTLEKRFLQLGCEAGIKDWVQMLESWHDEHNVYFVMELAFGSLRDKMMMDDYDLIEAKLWCREMLGAVAALRDHHIVHSDIKPDNFLMVNGGSVVLSDFGMAQTPEPALPTTAAFLEWRAFPGGTPGYYARQTLRKEGRYVSHATDIFGLGVVFAELLSHMRGALLWDVFRVPAEHADTKDVWMAMAQPARQKWLMEKYWLREVNLPRMSPEMDLIEQMLSEDGASVDELLAHRFFDVLFDGKGRLKYNHMTSQELPPLRVEREMRDLMFEAWHCGDEENGSYGHIRPSFAPVMNGSQVVRSRWLKDCELTKRQMREPFPSDFNWIWSPPRTPREPEGESASS
ncbi:hypothetical protein GSI_04755 [Ganoderma sinense ZZ0214-1]|uniref:Protein kinase domain-containing protein n=1 Tax=Ganoderma sinense ZZ0214-1 TaxID=1077348 RepID=A0A2G8SHQ4_9APHY|nr:hypothetical protein GSI_04755 [Ganoderma sinense ZZ0214-1]